MSASKKDPTEPIRRQAGRYAGVDEGTACTQSSFKVGKKAFLYIGTQGGRYKAMFKLHQSLPEAAKLAEKQPDDYQVGVNGWVTARFTADAPLPKAIWTRWLDESYQLSRGSGTAKKTPARKLSAKKPAATKSTAKQTATKKSVTKKTTTKKSASKRTSRKKPANR